MDLVVLFRDDRGDRIAVMARAFMVRNRSVRLVRNTTKMLYLVVGDRVVTVGEPMEDRCSARDDIRGEHEARHYGMPDPRSP